METRLKRVIGLADACELLCSVFRYPTPALAEGMSDGRIHIDAVACLVDAGVNQEKAEGMCEGVAALRGGDIVEVLEGMRRVYSFLYVRQGSGVAIFPYESPFLHTMSGRGGVPVLFRSVATLDVENSMRAVGVLPSDSRTEPCDSIWEEFEFASFLLGSLASALVDKNENECEKWETALRTFNAKHIQKWLPCFFSTSNDVLDALHTDGSVSDESYSLYKGLFAYAQTVVNLVNTEAE